VGSVSVETIFLPRHDHGVDIFLTRLGGRPIAETISFYSFYSQRLDHD
jgi:hypothetical protein